jgi:hypothetical protein
VPPGSELPFFPPEWACYAPEENGVAHLLLVFPQVCPTIAERAPSALEVGKSDPLRVWTFPFNEGASVECDGRSFLRAIGPQR